LSIFGELASPRSSENQQGANNDVDNVCRSKASIRARRKPIYDLVKATDAEEKQNDATKQDDDAKQVNKPRNPAAPRGEEKNNPKGCASGRRFNHTREDRH
jgi:hypothetical protein